MELKRKNYVLVDGAKKCRPAEYLSNAWNFIKDQPGERETVIKRLHYKDARGVVHVLAEKYWRERIFHNPPPGSNNYRRPVVEWVHVLFEAFDKNISLKDLYEWHADIKVRHEEPEPV